MPTSQQSTGRAWGNASQVIGKTVAATLKGVQKEVRAADIPCKQRIA